MLTIRENKKIEQIMKKERKKTYQFVILKNDCTFAIQIAPLS